MPLHITLRDSSSQHEASTISLNMPESSPPVSDPYILPRITAGTVTQFEKPIKRINTGDDLVFFLSSEAYLDLKTWILQLSRACLPQEQADKKVATRELDVAASASPAVRAVQNLLQALSSLIDKAPPDTGPRRFGNVAFRQWDSLVKQHIDELLAQHLEPVLHNTSALVELRTYLLESFGSSLRLDYGTGHELSYLAFLGGLWKLGTFNDSDQWSIVAGALEPYIELVRRLIKTYTLEPAGSHGVWGLDDHCFIPYILGSAQLAKPLSLPSEQAPYPATPAEGSLDSAPDPASITSSATVNEQRLKNFYFGAIGFILDVKKGPFFEHSPYLYNISGIKDGWGKINKGMLKMYDAEVLGKFPVVQHFPFGSLWRWEQDERAAAVLKNTHIASQPAQGHAMPPASGTQAPWAAQSANTQAPRARPGSTTASWTATPPTRSLPTGRR